MVGPGGSWCGGQNAAASPATAGRPQRPGRGRARLFRAPRSRGTIGVPVRPTGSGSPAGQRREAVPPAGNGSRLPETIFTPHDSNQGYLVPMGRSRRAMSGGGGGIRAVPGHAGARSAADRPEFGFEPAHTQPPGWPSTPGRTAHSVLIHRTRGSSWSSGASGGTAQPPAPGGTRRPGEPAGGVLWGRTRARETRPSPRRARTAPRRNRLRWAGDGVRQPGCRGGDHRGRSLVPR